MIYKQSSQEVYCKKGNVKQEEGKKEEQKKTFFFVCHGRNNLTGIFHV